MEPSVASLILFLHYRLAIACLLFSIVLAVWGTYQFLRRRRISPGFRSGYVLMILLTGVQGLLGLILMTVTQPPDILHIVYGAFAIIFLPGVYFYADRGAQERRQRRGRRPLEEGLMEADQRVRLAREAAFLIGACWVVAIAFARGFMTG